jgi:hypothetical protein
MILEETTLSLQPTTPNNQVEAVRRTDTTTEMFSTLFRPSRTLPPRHILRSFSSSPSSSFAPSTSFKVSIPSKVYPGLYYHDHSSHPTSFTLSYLPTPPPSLAFSPTTIGIVSPLPSSSARSPFDEKDAPGRPTEDERVPAITPRNFQENKQWLKLVHEVLEGAVEGDPWIQTQAKAAEGTDTYMCVYIPLLPPV